MIRAFKLCITNFFIEWKRLDQIQIKNFSNVKIKNNILEESTAGIKNMERLYRYNFVIIVMTILM